MPATRYSTRQGEAIEAYLRSLGGQHVTAEQVAQHFAGPEQSIGRTTIYRNLKRLEQEGKLRRFTLGGQEGACYQYLAPGEAAACADHFHLRCERCGTLMHLSCTELDAISAHVQQKHGFRIDPLKTIFYGVCADCLAKEGQ
jgi:Fur family ferric uptake transcriptional regulator